MYYFYSHILKINKTQLNELWERKSEPILD